MYLNNAAPLPHVNKTKSVDWIEYYRSDFAKKFVYEHWNEDFE